MGGGPAITRRPGFEKSNTEFTNSLRANFEACQQTAQETDLLANGEKAPEPSSTNGQVLLPWTQRDGDTLYVPAPSFSSGGLAEERSQYDITVKLFFLPTTRLGCRGAHACDAVDRVLRELHAPSLDLLIVSFPGVTFDADDDDDECDEADDATAHDEDEMARTWQRLEALQRDGTVSRLGLAEFSSERLQRFLPRTAVRPAVDQINVRDCCVVPKPLILFAKREGIELLTHNDCTNILPKGTIRELLGPGERGAHVLATDGAAELRGDIVPQWVVKYTAVVRDRGVIENKGYFAMAEIND